MTPTRDDVGERATCCARWIHSSRTVCDRWTSDREPPLLIIVRAPGIVAERSQHLGRITGDDGVCGHVTRHHGARADDARVRRS